MNEVVGYVDNHYRTINDKAHRAVVGLSLWTAYIIYKPEQSL